MRPRVAKVGQLGPNRGSKELKVSPRWSKGAPRGARDKPQRPQRGPKGIPRGPKGAKVETEEVTKAKKLMVQNC